LNLMKRLEIICAAVIVVGLASIYPLQAFIEHHTGDRRVEEALYLPSGKAVAKLSLGFGGLVSDIYWMRAIQYFGGKSRAGGLDQNSGERFELLYPMLEIATALDPQYIVAYEFGAMFIADYNSPEKAIELIKRGIAHNPNQWRLYQHLGFTYWKMKDYRAAHDAYMAGSRVPGAPPFMKTVAGQMLAEGGSRQTARMVFRQIYEESEDERVREAIVAKLKRLDALDQMDFLMKLTQAYREQTGQYPGSFRPFARILAANKFNLDSSGAPLDPDGFPYKLNSADGTVSLADNSTILRR